MIAKDKRIDFSTPVDELYFGSGYDFRIHNALHACEIETVKDLCKLQRIELFRLRSFGKKTVQAVETTLSEYGLKLGMDANSIELYQNGSSMVTDEEWERRRYEIAKEIYINKFSDYSTENAELALMAADDFIGVMRKQNGNKG